jgi:hypothetical protein
VDFNVSEPLWRPEWVPMWETVATTSEPPLPPPKALFGWDTWGHVWYHQSRAAFTGGERMMFSKIAAPQ